MHLASSHFGSEWADTALGVVDFGYDEDGRAMTCDLFVGCIALGAEGIQPSSLYCHGDLSSEEQSCSRIGA
jgi:hypothetical protein